MHQAQHKLEEGIAYAQSDEAQAAMQQALCIGKISGAVCLACILL